LRRSRTAKKPRLASGIQDGSDAQETFVEDFVAAWNKVMNLDRFDIKNPNAARVAAVA
jgi:catalase-peroxidase